MVASIQVDFMGWGFGDFLPASSVLHLLPQPCWLSLHLSPGEKCHL